VNSCLYEGSVRHRRHGTPADELRYRMFMLYLDLDELPQCLDGRLLWSARHPALAWFRRRDHLGDPRTPLADAVRELVAERTGTRPDGPIRLLTHLRYFGHCFNPVSFYYCYDDADADANGHRGAADERLSAVVAHVTNTPWGESHSYVLGAEHASTDRGSTALLGGRSHKQLHVSPLMGMEHTYEWRVSEPAERLSVHIESHRAHARAGESANACAGRQGDADGAGAVFDATLSLRRRELSGRELARALARYPLQTQRIVARIYGHALSLRLRGARYFPHPRTSGAAAGSTATANERAVSS